jgi:hypothetical protein
LPVFWQYSGLQIFSPNRIFVTALASARQKGISKICVVRSYISTYFPILEIAESICPQLAPWHSSFARISRNNNYF